MREVPSTNHWVPNMSRVGASGLDTDVHTAGNVCEAFRHGIERENLNFFSDQRVTKGE